MSEFTREMQEGTTELGTKTKATTSTGRPSPGATFGERQSLVPPVDGKFGEKWQAPDVPGNFVKKDTSSH